MRNAGLDEAKAGIKFARRNKQTYGKPDGIGFIGFDPRLNVREKFSRFLFEHLWRKLIAGCPIINKG